MATSTAFADNPASAKVSRRLGYVENGLDQLAPRGIARDLIRFRLTAEAWAAVPRPRVEVVGVEACRLLLGAEEQR